MMPKHLIPIALILLAPVISAESEGVEVVSVTPSSADVSEECRRAVEVFPIQPEVCADTLTLTADTRLRAELSSYLAIGYARTNQPTLAREAIAQALDADPEFWLIHANNGVMALFLKEFDGALAATNRALELADRDIPDLYLNQSLAARGSGDFSTSASAYQTYMTLMGFTKPEEDSNPIGEVPAPDSEGRFDRDPF